ncbi:MAG: FkbM family methyltransferase [Solibacillus sp.]
MEWYTELENNTVKKRVFLFGAGTRTLNFFKILPKDSAILDRIEAILDNSKEKLGELFLNRYLVESPLVLQKGNLSDIYIIITSGHYLEIEDQLVNQLNISKENIYYNLEYMVDEQFLQWQIKDEHREDIKKLKNSLFDEKSKKMLDEIIYNRNNNIFDYSNLKSDPQYFLLDILDFSNEEVFIDGGGYSGDTIKEFITLTDNKYEKIYSFEPGETSFAIIEKNFSNDERIECFNLGLWDKESSLFFEDNGLDLGNKVSTQGNIEIKVNSIDNLIQGPVTFIKMDIEGAELEALEGAKTIIQKYKPKLAICIYHKYDDLWRIPNYIKELVPEYKLFIRHHSLMNSDTVVYATI